MFYSISPQYAQCTTPHSANMYNSTIIHKNSTIFKQSILGISDAINQIQKIRVAEGLNGLFDATTVQQYTLAISGLNKQEAITLLQRQGLSTAQQAQILSSAGLLQTTQMLNASLVEEAVLSSKISGEKATQVLTELGVIDAKTENLIVTKACTAEEIKHALAIKGVVGADAEAILSQLGLATANTTTTASFAGLTTSIKAATSAMLKWLTTNPLGWATLAIGGFLGVSKVIDAFTTSEEEMTEAHQDSVQKVIDSISEYEELKQELQTVQQEYEDTEQKLKDLYRLRENQTITQAEEEYLEKLEGQNQKLREQIEYKQALANIEAKEVEDEAVKTLKEKTQNDISTAYSENGGLTTKYDKITDAEKIKQNTSLIEIFTKYLVGYEKVIQGKELTQEEINQFNKQLEGLQNQYNSIKGNDVGDEANRQLLQEEIDFYKSLLDGSLTYEQYDKMSASKKESVQKLISENQQLLEIIEPLNNAIVSTSGENYELKKANDAIIESAKKSVIGFNEYANALNDVDKALDTTKETAKEFNILDTISETVEHLDKKVKPVMDSLKSAYQDIFTEDGFTLDNVGVDMLNSVKESIAEINEIEGIDISTSAFEDFAKVLTNTETTEEQAHKAFNDLVGDIINGTDSLNVSSEAVNVLVQSLEEMGVTNAKEVVDEMLSIKENLNKLSDEAQGEVKVINDTLGGMGKEAVTSTNDLTECTWEEIEALMSASNTYGFTADKIKEYAAQKIWSNQNALDVSQDISQLLVVAKSAGIATKAIARYEEAKKLQKQGYGGGQGQVDALMKSAYQEVLDEIQTLYNFELPEYAPKYSSSSSKSSKDSTSTFDWIETKISNMEDELDSLDKKVANTYSKWEQRNKDLADSIAKTNEAIKLQENAANAYMNEANSLGISSHYKTLVQKGALNIEDISDKDLADKISEYQDLYEKSKECTDKANELRQTLNELSSSEKWDLLKSESDADIDILDKRIDAIQTSLDKLDFKGMFANSSYYNDMVDLTRNKISSLISQETELQNILKTMTTGTEAYDTMFAELMDIRNQIGELENECIEFNNNIRDLDWEIFEFFEDSISRITEEINFFKDLLSDEDMFDDSGNMTKYADATLGLHYANIETYKKKAQDYYEEMRDLQQQLVNGGGQDVLEKYREYEDLYRDMISNIKDQKDAILDLVSQAYEEQISALERINDLTLERMDRERDLYNYQKNIAEKTKEKTSLERQIDVYSNSDSEESVAKVQQLKLELEKVNSDIEDMEYEQQRADTEAMLTNITEDFKLWQSQRLDNEAGLLENIRSEVESKSNEIQATLKEVAGQYGTTLSTSLTSIFGSENPFDNVVTAINNLIAKISGIVGGDNTSNSNSGSGGGSVADTNKPVTQGKTTTATQNTQTDTQSKPESDGIFIPQKSVYPKNKLDKEKSVVDRLKYFDFASDFQSRATYYKKLGGTGTYTGSASQNKWLLSKMKEMGYVSGTNYAKKGLHWTQENGDELIIRKSDGALLTPLGMGDKVVNAEGTNNLFTFANDPQGFLEKFGVLNYTPNLALPKMPNIQPRNISNEVNLGGVHIAQVVTSDAQDFMRQLPSVIANDTKTQKVISEVVLGGALGRNSMSAKRFL